jgi:uncharacterized membrane protein YjgN (DUF898 family)
MRKESTFTGSNWGLIWRSVAMSYGMILTLFIATPWLLAWYYKWYYGHTIIDNTQLEFTGSGKNMFFIYTYLLLTVITFFFASLFMMAWLERKSMAFVHFIKSNE